MTQTRMVGDTYPPLTFFDVTGFPIDLTGCRVTYDFVPDSKRAKFRRKVNLRIIDPHEGKVTAPRARTSGWATVRVHYPNGTVETVSDDIRFERLQRGPR